MINIESITYSNEKGESVTINLAQTELEYRYDRITDLLREMMSGGRELGPPPRRKDGEQAAWIGGE